MDGEKMKNNKGITLTSLVLYVISFLVICGIIALITTFFYNNEKVLSDEATSSVDFDIINTYLVKECNIENNKAQISNIDDPSNIKIVFENEDEIHFYGDVGINANGTEVTNKAYFIKKEKCFLLSENIKSISCTSVSNLEEDETVNNFEITIEIGNETYTQKYYIKEK